LGNKLKEKSSPIPIFNALHTHKESTSVTEVKSVLSNFAESIPKTHFGPDRIIFIADNIEKMKGEEKLLLRKYFNKLLTGMIEREASDIELGGHGNGGYVWMRIFGKKERVNDMPQFSEDEAAIMIINLLNSNQRKFLTETRNLDFS